MAQAAEEYYEKPKRVRESRTPMISVELREYEHLKGIYDQLYSCAIKLSSRNKGVWLNEYLDELKKRVLAADKFYT